MEELDVLKIGHEWAELQAYLSEGFLKKPDLNAVVFLIGVQELGKGKKHFSKEEKQDLMHIAICKLLSFDGFYELKGFDKDGWPHWELAKELPFLNIMEQETMLKNLAIQYFNKEVFGYADQDNHL